MKTKNSVQKQYDAKKIAMRVSAVTIIVNLFLSVIKLLAGLIASSAAMVSDAVHSASDVFSTIIVIIGINISSKEADDKHPYGHERLECVAAILLSVVLFATGIGIGISGIDKIIAGNYDSLEIPGILALIAAVVSIAVKEWMYHYTKRAAVKINSGALKADAWHHRSDALSSIGALVGIVGARLGFPILDSIASVVICLFIGKASFDIFKDAVDKLVDKSCDNAVVEQICEVVQKQDGVLGIDKLQTRLFGPKIYVDVEILADGEKTLWQAHEIAENVHDAIEREFPSVKHCMVHVNPAENDSASENQ